MRWSVVSPEFDYTEWVCEYGGPTYSIRDYAEVEANTAREAKWKAYRTMEEWPDVQRGDNLHPIAGMIAVALCPICVDEQMEGVNNWHCPVCGEWWETKFSDERLWDVLWHRGGQSFTPRERTARIRRWLAEHPDYPT